MVQQYFFDFYYNLEYQLFSGNYFQYNKSQTNIQLNPLDIK